MESQPAISLHSHHVSLVQWTTHLLPVMRDLGSKPLGGLMLTGILLLALSRYIGDPNVIRSLPLLPFSRCLTGLCANNVKSRLDLTQLFCPSFTLTAGPASDFTTDRVGCREGALWRACNLTTFTPCLTGPVDYPFASRHEGPGFKLGGNLCETGILLLVLSRYRVLFSFGFPILLKVAGVLKLTLYWVKEFPMLLVLTQKVSKSR